MHGTMKEPTTMKAAKHVTLSLWLFGCGSATAAAVLAGCESPSDPQPPSGGQVYVMDFDTFTVRIDPILTAHGCDHMACHGGGIRGTFELSPNTDKDVALDFTQASLQVNPANPAASPLLTKALAESAGGVAHAAPFDAFASTSDPDYQAILAWIEAGEYR
jgi:hypothetical protein